MISGASFAFCWAQFTSPARRGSGGACPNQQATTSAAATAFTSSWAERWSFGLRPTCSGVARRNPTCGLARNFSSQSKAWSLSKLPSAHVPIGCIIVSSVSFLTSSPDKASNKIANGVGNLSIPITSLATPNLKECLSNVPCGLPLPAKRGEGKRVRGPMARVFPFDSPNPSIPINIRFMNRHKIIRIRQGRKPKLRIQPMRILRDQYYPPQALNILVRKFHRSRNYGWEDRSFSGSSARRIASNIMTRFFLEMRLLPMSKWVPPMKIPPSHHDAISKVTLWKLVTERK